MITLTDTAADKVKDLIEAEGDADLALRVAVRPGGCSGFSYEMFFDTDVADDDTAARLRRASRSWSTRRAPAPRGRHARLQGRPPGRRVRHRQPQRPAHLRLRPELQLTGPGSGQRPEPDRLPLGDRVGRLAPLARTDGPRATTHAGSFRVRASAVATRPTHRRHGSTAGGWCVPRSCPPCSSRGAGVAVQQCIANDDCRLVRRGERRRTPSVTTGEASADAGAGAGVHDGSAHDGPARRRRPRASPRPGC